MAAPNTQSTVLDAFGVELLSAIHKIREPVSFSAGERIFEQNSMADAFYIIDAGEVAIEVPDARRRHRPGAGGRSSRATSSARRRCWAARRTGRARSAATDVELVRVAASDLRTLYKEQPEEGVAVLRAMARYTANRLRDASARVAESLADDAPDPVVDEMVATAVAAQARVRVLAGGPRRRAARGHRDLDQRARPELAADTVAETTLGNADHKAAKIQFGSMSVLRDAARRGRLRHRATSTSSRRSARSPAPSA